MQSYEGLGPHSRRKLNSSVKAISSRNVLHSPSANNNMSILGTTPNSIYQQSPFFNNMNINNNTNNMNINTLTPQSAIIASQSQLQQQNNNILSNLPSPATTGAVAVTATNNNISNVTNQVQQQDSHSQIQNQVDTNPNNTMSHNLGRGASFGLSSITASHMTSGLAPQSSRALTSAYTSLRTVNNQNINQNIGHDQSLSNTNSVSLASKSLMSNIGMGSVKRGISEPAAAGGIGAKDINKTSTTTPKNLNSSSRSITTFISRTLRGKTVPPSQVQQQPKDDIELGFLHANNKFMGGMGGGHQAPHNSAVTTPNNSNPGSSFKLTSRLFGGGGGGSSPKSLRSTTPKKESVRDFFSGFNGYDEQKLLDLRKDIRQKRQSDSRRKLEVAEALKIADATPRNERRANTTPAGAAAEAIVPTEKLQSTGVVEAVVTTTSTEKGDTAAIPDNNIKNQNHNILGDLDVVTNKSTNNKSVPQSQNQSQNLLNPLMDKSNSSGTPTSLITKKYTHKT